MRRLVCAVFMATIVSQAFAVSNVFLLCKGQSGIAAGQGTLALSERDITSNAGPVHGSIELGAQSLEVAGMPFMNGKYEICSRSDQELTFGYSCIDHRPGTDNDQGVMNLVSGEVRYGMGDSLFVVFCVKVGKAI